MRTIIALLLLTSFISSANDVKSQCTPLAYDTLMTATCYRDTSHLSLLNSSNLDYSFTWFVKSEGSFIQIIDTSINGLEYVNSETETLTILPTTFVGEVEYKLIRYYDGIVCDSMCFVNSFKEELLVYAGENVSYCLNSSDTLNGEDEGLTYSWEPMIGLSNPNVSNPIVSVTESQNFVLTGVDDIGCRNSDSVFVTVYPLPTVDAGMDISFCFGESISLNASSEGVSNYWLPTSGLVSPTSLNTGVTSASSQSYTLTAVSENGCLQTDDVFVTVYPLPIVNAGDDLNLCFGEQGQLNGISNSEFIWSPLNGLEDPADLNSSVNISQDQFYILTAVNSFNCISVDSVWVYLHEPPTLDLVDGIQLCLGYTANIECSGADSYMWYPNFGLSNYDQNNVDVIGENSMWYFVQGSNQWGCISTDSVFIEILDLPNPIIENTFAICENTSFQLYQGYFLSNSDLVWTVNGGQIEGGQYSDRIYVSWDSNESCTISVTETRSDNGCSAIDVIEQEFSGGYAPDLADVFFISSNLLGCSDIESEIFKWGVTAISNNMEWIIQEGTPYVYLNSFDPSNYYYWVEHGDDIECLTRSYLQSTYLFHWSRDSCGC
jgi:hypothetical protein